MIKTIKVEKQLKLGQLITEVWEGRLPAKTYKSDKGLKVVYIYPDRVSFISTENLVVSEADTFTVEVEEDITEDTYFEDITVVFKSNSADETGHFYNSTLRHVKKAKNLMSAYIPLSGKLELIWERGEND